jgi:hypothetical protein
MIIIEWKALTRQISIAVIHWKVDISTGSWYIPAAGMKLAR